MTLRRRRRLLMLFGAAAGGIILLALVLLTYLLSADLGRHRERIAYLLSSTLGYEVRIGELHIDLALHGPARLEARHVTLVNQTRSDEPLLAEIDRLSAAVELRPLFGRRVVVRELEVGGGSVAVEFTADGRSNWSLPGTSGPPPAGPAPPIPRIVLQRAMLNDLHATIQTAGAAKPMVLDASRLELSTDPDDTLQLQLAGSFDEWPIDLTGTIGPLAELMIAGDVRSDLRLTAGGAALEVAGRIADLGSLHGIDATLSANGPEIDAITDRFGLPSLGSGPFRLSAAVKPDGADVGLELEAGLGDLTASGHGRLDSVTDPRRLDLTVDAQGPSLSAAAALRGLHGLPDLPFHIAGRIAWDGFPLTLEKVIVRVGENTIDVDGVLGEPPSFSGTGLRIEGDGPDLSAIGSLLDIALPTLHYRIAGRLGESGGIISLDQVEASIGRNRLQVKGTLGRLPELTGIDLAFHAHGPGLAPFSRLAGIVLPDEPFDLCGRIVPGTDRWKLDKARLRLGAAEVRLSGIIATGPRFVGSRLRLHASGDDLSSLAWAHGLDDLPAVPFRISGEIAVERSALTLGGIEAGVGGLDLSADGRLATRDGLNGSELAIAINGRLTDLEPFTGRHDLPDTPFTVSGTVAVEGDAYRLETLRATLDEHRLGIDGRLVPANGLAGSKAAVTLSGPDLAGLGHLVSALGKLPDLPDEPYSLNGSVTVDADGFDLSSLRATLGRSRATVDGRLGRPPGLRRTDLTLSTDGPDASRFGAAFGLDLPDDPFAIRGGIRRIAGGVEFDGMSIRLGDTHLLLDGSIGEPPQLIGSDFHFSAAGPDFGLIERLTEKKNLPRQPFHIEGRASGSPRRFRVDELDLGIGDTDVRGYLRLGLEGRMELEGRLESTMVDLLTILPSSDKGVAVETVEDPSAELEALISGRETPPGDDEEAGGGADGGNRPPAATTTPPATAGATRKDAAGKARRFGDEPFDLSWLDRLDADVTLRIDRLRATSEARDLELSVQLAHGHLLIGPFEAVGARGGRVNGRLKLEPLGDRYDMGLEFNIDDAWGDLTGGSATAKEDLTHIDAAIDLHSSGRTPHEVAAGAEGHIIVFLEGGRVDDSLLSITLFSALRRFLSLINPFAKEQQGPAALDCAAFMLDFDAGLMELDPLAFQTDNVTIIGRGDVNLDSERLNLEWVAKPRKGVGISTTTLTNPYIKLGGTLSRPAVDVKPVQAVTSTGIAVATGGLSLLGKGLWDRVTAERKVCKRARKKAEHRLAGDQPHRK